VRVLSRVFRGKFIDLLRRARTQDKLLGAEDAQAFERLLDAAVRHEWVVYAKPPFGGPQQVLKYLSRYTHRIAVSNRRLLEIDARTVTFAYKDYAHGNRPRRLTLGGEEFLRRFLLHAVPPGFMRIRQFGLLANRVRTANLQQCRGLIGAPAPVPIQPMIVRASSIEQPCCPACGHGRLRRGENLTAPELARLVRRLDSS
jgi:hypothetical protein